ncbi:MAG TPA: immunoglobulin-like domain-containing protein [Pyrinomonadaceae bacterium]
MKPTNLPPKYDLAHTVTVTRRIQIQSRSLILRVSAILVLAGLLAGSLYWSSAASASKNASPYQKTAVALDEVTAPLAVAKLNGSPSLRAGSLSPLLPVPQAGVSVTTYAGDCTTPKSLFNLQDTDLTVCAKVTGAESTWRIIWSNANNVAVQNVAVGSGTSTFTLTSTSSLGDWRVILYEPFGGTVQAVTSFTVIDADNPKADLSVSKGAISSSASAGSQVVFSVQVSNAGPSAGSTVQLSDSVPGNTTFVSFDQLSGPTFNCTNPTAGSASGDTICTIASLARGDVATFVATYEVSSGPVISNTASISSTTPDPNSDNNSSTAELPVSPTPCNIASPDNITVDAESGQSGAVVTYATPSYTGDCGPTPVGETSPISCNPVSGSFFPAGTTTVICVAQAGPAVSFQVTVNNPGALSISLNGASTVSVECGTDFNDPGATAIDGTGQSLPACTEESPTNCWSVTLPQGFNPDAPAVGSYTLTYTATETTPNPNPPPDDITNSVSTTRTVNVSDNEAPAITVDGANPYKIQQGSCSPFVDPGATALDGCAGSKPVSSSISGPGGATSVDPNVAGTYTVTYTATDGTHEATATRTVLVGNFPEDEVDQPASSNQPPTITLNGDDQMSIECGTPFTDPGATATVCGNSIAVTTSGTVDIHTPGTYSITYSATANGQTAEATRIVTVEADNTAPTIQVLGDNPMTVECHTSFTDPGATAHDACAGDFAATPSGAVDPDTVGQYIITYNATDPSGHAAAPVTRTVNVVDTTAPVVTAPANVTVNTGQGATSCGTTVSDATLGTASASDSCAGSLSVTRTGVPAGNVFPVGTTTITYSANDGYNTGTATQTVTVIDNTAPTISCPADIIVSNAAGLCSAVVNFSVTASDNCAGVTVNTDIASGSTFPKGTTTVHATATDASGNTSTCSFTVTVNDTENPVISCPANITLEPTCPSGAIATYATPVGTDNCPGATTARTAGLASGSVFPIGTTTVSHMVTDASGNTASCSFTVTVLTPQNVIQNLINSVNASSLTGTQKNGLLAKLNAALSAIDNGQTNIACNKLSEFVNNVGNLINQGSLTAAQGDAWISSANHVRNTIGCTNLGCS